MKLFKYKSALDIPELKNSPIADIIKKATSGNQYRVPPHVISQINDLGTNTVNCAVIITGLLRVFDEFGSHPIPVYRSLSILLMLLKSGRDTFIPVARALVPEIQTVLYLSFGEKRVLFRDQIHLMATSIYYFLMYDATLPDITDLERNMTSSVKVHLPPPPVDDSSMIKPKVFMSQSAPKSSEPNEDEDMDIPFEPKAFRPPPPQIIDDEHLQEPEPEPPAAVADLPTELIPRPRRAQQAARRQQKPKPKPEPEIAPEPEPEPEQESESESEDFGQPQDELKEESRLQAVTKAMYDFSIESF